MNPEEKIAQILSILFEKDIAVGDNFSMVTEELWDSMKHIEVIVTLEEELGISFEITDIPRLTSMQLILDAVKRMG